MIKQKTGKYDFDEWDRIIKNTPDNCAYCGKEWKTGTIQRFIIEGERREPLCNIDCAIKLTYKRCEECCDRALSLAERASELLKIKRKKAEQMKKENNKNDQCPKCKIGKLKLISDTSHLVVYGCNQCKYKREIIPPDV